MTNRERASRMLSIVAFHSCVRSRFRCWRAHRLADAELQQRAASSSAARE